MAKRFRNSSEHTFSFLRIGFLSATLSLPIPAVGAVEYYITAEFLSSTCCAVGKIGNTGMVAIGTLPGIGFLWKDGVYLASTPNVLYGAINSAEQVAGTDYTDKNTGRFRAFLWDRGTTTFLDPRPNLSTAPYSINDAAQVVGTTYGTPSETRATLWDKGTVSDLGTLPGYLTSGAADINNSGQIVGSNQTDGFPFPPTYMAFIWTDGTMSSLGTLGGASSGAWSINDAGEVVGGSQTAQGTNDHAFLWKNGSMADLGTLSGGSSLATAINNRGEIVGSSDNRAVIWRNGEITDLNSLVAPGSNLSFDGAFDNNDLGQILVAVTSATGVGGVHVVLLTPVPEPQTWLMLLLGVAVLAWKWRTTTVPVRSASRHRSSDC